MLINTGPHITLRGWRFVHTWTSLVCTVFLLMLCLTGLPLIFHDEIDDALGGKAGAGMVGPPSSGSGPGLLPLDAVLRRALATRPGAVPLFMAFDNAGPLTTVTTGPRADAGPAAMTMQTLDRATGAAAAAGGEAGAVTAFLLRLHTDLLLGLAGELFLGAMGVVFVAAIVSGVVLYAPFMRKLPFGTLRTTRTAWIGRLDEHNLLGIVAGVWMAAVGVTGTINALATPIMAAWQAGALAEMTRGYAGRAPLPPARYGSLDRAMAAARVAVPGSKPQFIAFPGGTYSSRHHYAVFFQGDTPLTERLLTAALVDAATGRVTDVAPMPWYTRMLSLAQPLHFGDYGGWPLKLLWAVLDLFTIRVLVSGLMLWLGRRRRVVVRRHEAAAATVCA